MKLAARVAVPVVVAFVAAAGVAVWLLGTRLAATGARVEALTKELAERGLKEAELATRLAVVSSGRDATGIAARAAERLAAFITEKKESLGDPAVAARVAAGADAQAAIVGERLGASRTPLDQVLVVSGRGVVAAVAPANAALAGRPYLTADELRFYARQDAPVFTRRRPESGQAWLISAGIPAFARGAGGRRVFAGVLLEVASLEQILKPVLAGGDTAPRVLVVDREGTVVFSPSADLAGKPLGEALEFKPLEGVTEGEPVELRYNLGRWMAVRRGAPLGMAVIGLAPIGAAAGAGGAGSPAAAARPPWVLAGAAILAGLVLALLAIMPPLGRLGQVARSGQALAGGATAVEFKSAGAGDEIGAIARAMQQLGEQLAAERAHREEMTQAYATIQRDVQRLQTENKELQEYQQNLEAKARQTQAALEGEVAQARQETETARGEIEVLRAQVAERDQGIASRDEAVAARDQAIAQRDQALVERDAALTDAGAQLQALQEQLVNLQQSVESLSQRLADASTELERRRAAPESAFGLFAEASEALAGEMAGLLELVQGYISQIVEASGGAISDEQQQFLATVINRSARSQRLMGDLRDFANIVRPDGLAKEPVDLLALLTDTAASVQDAAEARNVTLDAALPETLPEAMGDEARLKQMFTTLLNTAVRFTPEGGTVRMSVALRETLAGIRIEDGGESIPAKSEEVFDHFHSPDEEILELRGSGLRFPILRAIVTAHGGAIDLAITEQGTNLFFVRLPVRANAPTMEQTATLFDAVPTGEAAGPAPFDFGGGAGLAGAMAGSLVSADEPAPSYDVPPPPPAPDLSAAGPGFEAIPEFDAMLAAGPPAAPSLEAVPSLDAIPSLEAAPDLTAAPDTAAFDFGAVPDLSAADLSAAPTTESIMAATPDTDPAAAPDALWTVPGEPAPAAELSAAPEATGTEPAPASDAPAPAAGFAFGSDEIIQE